VYSAYAHFKLTQPIIPPKKNIPSRPWRFRIIWYGAVVWHDTLPLFYKTRHRRGNTTGDNPEDSVDAEPEVK